MTRLIVAALAVLTLCTPKVAVAETVLTGTAGQSFYKIVVPDVWNGDLVIWNHGFTLSPVGPVSDLGPLAPVQLAEGYAVAASSYRLAGWALFRTNEDLEALYQTFVTKVGVPGNVFVTGGSLGGLVTARAIEEAQLGNVVGALSLCGVVGGSRNWDLALDVRLLYDAICAEVLGASIPGGPEGLPAGSTFSPAQLAGAINACFGIPGTPTVVQQVRLATFLLVTKLPANFLPFYMGYAVFALSDLVHDPAKLKGRIGIGNANVVYGIPSIDAAIERVTPHPGAMARLQENYTPTGNVGSTRIVSLHTDKDGFVVVENENEYAAVVPAANLTTAVVVEETPTHCGFNPAEALAAWESLRLWVAGGPQPTSLTMQGLCTVFELSVSGPCRIDPTFVIPDLDTRIRPR